MKKLLLLVLSLSSVALMAQSSLFQNSAGESAFKTTGGNIILNTAEAAIKLNYAPMQSYGNYKTYGGVSIDVKGNDGIAPIISDGVFDPKGSLGSFFTFYANSKKTVIVNGISEPISKYKINYFTLSPRITRAKISLIDTADLFVQPVYKSVTGFVFEAAFSKIGFIGDINTKKHSSTVFGISVSAGVTDNSTDLGLSKFDLVTTQYNSDSSAALINKMEISGHNKDAFDKSISYGTLNADWGIYPYYFDRRLVTAIHLRSRFTEAQSSTNIGIGLYLTKKGAPANIVGGVNFMITDVFGQIADTNLKNRTALNLVLGVSPF
jgi:hypothetical protein